jgi:putative iron-regulated protein
MKKLIFILAMLTATFAKAEDVAKANFLQGYATDAYIKYEQAVAGARQLDVLIQTFIAEPNEATLQAAKDQWLVAKKLYGATEVYRYFDSPIDNENGPESAINSWPLDEAYIDSVVGNTKAGIINNAKDYPVIDEELLLELNAKDGEENISTGWHAIEFLLWGQDFYVDSAGRRPVTDYTTGKNADRRKQYLSVISQLLVKQLDSVAVQWAPNDKTNFAGTFASLPNEFKQVMNAVKTLAGEELSKERLFVAYESQLQEDEHDCFSDNTSEDLAATFVGVKNVLTSTFNGVSFVSMVAEKDAALAESLSKKVAEIEIQFLALPTPFDQAILDTQSRILIKSIIDNLDSLAEMVSQSLVAVES